MAPPSVACPGTASKTRIGAVAQLGERRVRNAEVRGSIPLGSTKRLHQGTPDRLASTVLCKINTLALLLAHLHWYTRGATGVRRSHLERRNGVFHYRRRLADGGGSPRLAKRVFRSEHYRKDARRFPGSAGSGEPASSPPAVVVELPIRSPGPGFICRNHWSRRLR